MLTIVINRVLKSFMNDILSAWSHCAGRNRPFRSADLQGMVCAVCGLDTARFKGDCSLAASIRAVMCSRSGPRKADRIHRRGN